MGSFEKTITYVYQGCSGPTANVHITLLKMTRLPLIQIIGKIKCVSQLLLAITSWKQVVF